MNETKQQLKLLDQKRQTLESEASAITSELNAPTIVQTKDGKQIKTLPMGIDTPLVDGEGYPRNDINVFRARELRKRLAEIRFDHSALMKEIEQGLLLLNTTSSSNGNVGNSSTTSENKMDAQETKKRMASKPKPKFDPITKKWVCKNFDGSVAGVENGGERSFDNLTAPPPPPAAASSSSSSNIGTPISQPQDTTTTTTNTTNTTTTEEGIQSIQELNQESIASYTPFALIDIVSNGSPAHDAGLQVNDLIIEFGSLTSRNDEELTALADICSKAALDQTCIQVVVLRDGVNICQKIVMNLRPRTWAGRGLLGCHLKRYSVCNHEGMK